MAEMTIGSAAQSREAKEKQRSIENQKLAMWLYLASEVVIFSVLIGGYAIFRVSHPENVHAVHKELGVLLVTINTFLLLTSSWAMVMGLRAFELRDKTRGLQFLGLTALLGTIFVMGQWIEYRELAHLEITLGGISDTFGGFGMRFYSPTAFHGAHVIIGVLWCLLVMWRGWKGRYDDNTVGIELFGLYWHFVDVVWILLFTLIYLV